MKQSILRHFDEAAGARRAAAARELGLAPRTIERWRAEGARDDGEVRMSDEARSGKPTILWTIEVSLDGTSWTPCHEAAGVNPEDESGAQPDEHFPDGPARDEDPPTLPPETKPPTGADPDTGSGSS